MGGSGGSGLLGPSDPGELRTRLRQTEEGARSAQFETQVGELIATTLAAYNDRDVEGTREVLEKVTAELGQAVAGTVDLFFGGSVAKHTYIDGLSDVDALVLLEQADVSEDTPAKLRALFTEQLRARFGRDKVEEGDLAVTLTVDNKTIQLLPALRAGEHFKISSYDGLNWSQIKPREFATALTDANQALDAKLVPTIKLAKGIIASLPEQRRLTGYHTEALAIEALRDYEGPKTPKAMLRHLFEAAPLLVQKPMVDSTGQSRYIDEYMGEAGSIRRQVAADALDRIARKIRNADGAQSVPRWQELLGGV
jgi:hypothetical protein